MRLTSRAFLDTAADQAAARQARRARSGGRRPDRADRRPGRAARSRARIAGRRSLRRRAARGSPRCSATGSISSCSATAGPRKSRSSRACSISPMRNGIALVATNEPFYGRREDFEAHDALICIAGRPAGRRVRAAPAFGRALLQVARRDDGAVRRSARGARLDGGDRAALRVPAEDAQADPAALHRAGRQRGRRGRRAAPAGRGRA